MCGHWTCPGYPAMVESVFEIGSSSSGGGCPEGSFLHFSGANALRKVKKTAFSSRLEWLRSLSQRVSRAVYRREQVSESRKNDIFLKINKAEVDLKKSKKQHFFKDWWRRLRCGRETLCFLSPAYGEGFIYCSLVRQQFKFLTSNFNLL